MSVSGTSPRFSGRTVSAPLPVRSRPQNGRWLVHRADGGRTVLLSPSVLSTAYSVEEEHAPAETGGLLFGRAFVDSEGPYVVVSSATPPRSGEVIGAVSTVRITAAGASAMTERAQARCFETDVVGWYHTHPSFDAYFSSIDETEQRSWASALAVGLVVAGVSRADDRYKVYVGPDSAPTRLERSVQRHAEMDAALASPPGPLVVLRQAPLVGIIRPSMDPRELRAPVFAGVPASPAPPPPPEAVAAQMAAWSDSTAHSVARGGSGVVRAVLVVSVLLVITICMLGYFVARDDGQTPNRSDSTSGQRSSAPASSGGSSASERTSGNRGVGASDAAQDADQPQGTGP